MKMYKLLFLIIASTSAFSQVNLMQDSTDIRWMELENEYFEVIYPQRAEEQAQYTMSLLNYYRTKVSATYKEKSQKISIVLRPNSADPNGFVTLTPRRSEWFMNTSFDIASV